MWACVMKIIILVVPQEDYYFNGATKVSRLEGKNVWFVQILGGKKKCKKTGGHECKCEFLKSACVKKLRFPFVSNGQLWHGLPR